MKFGITGAFGALAMAALLAIPAASAQGATRAPPVKATLDTGVIVGETRDGVNTFRGVPFAQPPVGDLRWKPPQKPSSWTIDRAATAFESPCPQPTSADGRSPNGGGVWGTTHEDCLYLNVYAPANANKAPIVVWLYGGASYLGAGHLGGYNGTENAKHGVITIPINYRLGSLGQFSHPALTAESKADEGLGSFALMDAVAALEWVQRNAEAFGGDPNNVTIAGQSAGGFMVVSLLSIPSAKGLFHKAIVQSGAGLRPATPLSAAEQRGAEAAATLGFGPNPTAAQLRSVPAQTLVANTGMSRPLGTPVDNRFMTTSTLDALNAKTAHAVPVMVGSNNGEGGFDGARRLAQLAAGSGAPSFLYQFAYVPEWRKPDQPRGAPHSAEIVYTFNTWNFSSSGDPRVNDTDRAVAARVNSCWVAFYKMDPKAKSLSCAEGFVWPAYTEAADQAAVFETRPKIVASKTLPNGPPPGAPRGSMAPD